MTDPNFYEEVAPRRPALAMNLLIVNDEEATRELCVTVAAQTGLRATAVPSPISPTTFSSRAPWTFSWLTSSFPA